MTNNPLFTIITVCYNSVSTIERTFQSVLNQSFDSYEYIVIDGNSKDGTVDLIRKYEKMFMGRMKWISEPDKGIYDAFNKGIMLSNGTLTWIVNSDDFIEADVLDYIAKIYSKYDNCNKPIISFAANFVSNKNGKIIKKLFQSKQDTIKNFKRDGQGIVHPATIIPRYVYDKLGWYDERFRIAGDIDFFHRAYKNKIPIDNIDHIITNMSYGGISTTSTFGALKNDRKYFFSNKYKNYLVRIIKYNIWLFNQYRIRNNYIKENIKKILRLFLFRNL